MTAKVTNFVTFAVQTQKQKHTAKEQVKNVKKLTYRLLTGIDAF